MAIGINVRSTPANVVDPAGHTYFVGRPDEYPTLRGGFTFGRVGGDSVDQIRDTVTTYPRFAGFYYPTISGSTVYSTSFRLLLPAAGTYPVKMAFGRVDQAVSAGGTVRVRDGIGGTILQEITLPATTATQLVDITNTVVEPTNWDSEAGTLDLTFSTTDLVVELGVAGDTAAPLLAHVFVGDVIANTPTISNVDGDNAVNQGQLANIDVSSFIETITSGDIGGVAFPSIPDNDPSDDVIQVRIPVTLAAGTYDVTISGATETDTISGVTYTQTHARPAFDGLVDSNSILSGQSYTANTYFRFVSSFSNGTLDLAAGDAAEWAGDIADYYTPNAGFTGDDTASIEFLYSDGTTSATVGVTINVPDTLKPAIDSVDVPTAGTYHVGQTLTFTTNWNEVVNVTGVPALNLDMGGSARQANYVSGTGTAALVFEYTVQEGDLDEDGVAVVSLTLDGGTIKDGASNDAYLTLNSVGDTAGVLVDGLPIAVASVSVPTVGTYSPGNDLDFTVNFESAVDVTGTPELVLDIGGEVRGADYVSGNGTSVLLFRYTVVSGDADADGIGVSSLSLAGGTIKDAYGVNADLILNGVGDTSGVLVDGVGPAISISPLTTLDTTPIVSGSAGDAASLTLVVTGVGTYNPIPSGGSWSQQLPTLALGDYPMTLNGEDANGNAAVERTATLSIVEEIVTADAGLFRSLFTEQGINLFKSLFR